MTGAYQLRREVHPAEQLSYAVGDAGFNLLWAMYDSFLLYFLVQVARSPAVSITPIILCSRSADLLTSVAFGLFGDRVQTRYGSYRPYLFWLAPPLSLVFVLLFTNPSLAAGRLPIVAWTGMAAVLFAVLYSAANAAYTALLTVLTADERTRVRAASLRFAFAAAGVLAVQYLALPVAARTGGVQTPRGWTAPAILCALGCWATLWLTAAGTRERLPVTSHQSLDIPFDLQRIAKDAKCERGLGMLALAIVLCLAALSCRGAATPFFVDAAAGEIAWTGPALAVSSLAAFFVCVAVPALIPARWLAPIPIASGCAAAGAVLCSLPTLWGATTHWKLLALQAAFGLGTGLLLPTLFVLVSSPPLRSGSSLTPALLAASTLLALKTGSAAGALVASETIARAHSAGLSAVKAHGSVERLFTVWPAALFGLTLLSLLLAGWQRRHTLLSAEPA